MTAETSAGRTAMRRARYGVDAPWMLAGVWLAGVVSTVWTVVAFAHGWQWPFWVLLVATLYWLGSAASFTYTTLRGKFVVWEDELDRLALAGHERVVDLGCGRGAVLLAAARRVPGGRALGVDLWLGGDQWGNAEAATRANAVAEGVSDRVDLMTADLRELPLPDGCAEVVVSSLAMHNIQKLADRSAAVREAWRVLAPGGRLRIADFRNIPYYAGIVSGLGAEDVAVRSLGWRAMIGGPWFGMSMLSATKPLAEAA